METKRLIPYSVHLREDIHAQLRAVAKGRKAASMVRDAITMIVEGKGEFESGYQKAVNDITKLIASDAWASQIAIKGETISDCLIEDIKQLAKKHAKAE
jgi:hypothetical protein